jgi:putative endonuclease
MTARAPHLTQEEKAERGKRAEDAVARRLWWDGYRILDRNYAVRGGEVDIVARKGDTVAFVEVRARREGSIIAPKDTVRYGKQRRIATAARAYAKAKRLTDVLLRYDIAEVWLDEKGKPKRIDVLEGAFGDPRQR